MEKQQHIMDIDKAAKIAKLAHLALSPKELNDISENFDSVFTLIHQMQSVDTEGVQPTINTNGDHMIMLPDHTDEICSREELLANAPKKKYGYFIVPKIIE